MSLQPAQPLSEAEKAALREYLANDIDRSCCRYADAFVDNHHFDFLAEIGSGNLGVVHLVQKKAGADQGTRYAMKTVLKEATLQKASRVKRVWTERKVLLKLQDTGNATKLFYAFESSFGLHFVLEYHSGGDVESYIKTNGVLKQKQLQVFIAEVVLGLKFLHDRSILYRDLKLQNLLIGKNGRVILADFGIAYSFLEGQATQLTSGYYGTVGYMAPEILDSEQYYGFSVDFWSLGCLIHTVATFDNPFDCSLDDDEIYDEYVKVRHPIIARRLSPRLKKLIAGLLNKNVSKRINMSSLLLHAYFLPLRWSDVQAGRLQPPFKNTLSRSPEGYPKPRNFRQILDFKECKTYKKKNVFSGFRYNYFSPEVNANDHWFREFMEELRNLEEFDGVSIAEMQKSTEFHDAFDRFKEKLLRKFKRE